MFQLLLIYWLRAPALLDYLVCQLVQALGSFEVRARGRERTRQALLVIL